jgi:predicted YcjX-like family ATPase
MNDASQVTSAVDLEEEELKEQKQVALELILDAWHEARIDGVSPDLMANAALFAALSDLISTYGEEAVVELTEGLPDRIRRGDYTLKRTAH